MNTTPTHEEVHEMLSAAALDILDSADLERVLVHARDCAECRQLLGEFREVVAALVRLLPSRQMDPARAALLRARLIARAQESLPGGAADPKVAAVIPRSSRAASLADRWSGWMVAAGLAGVLLVHHAVHRPLDYGWLAAGALAVFLIALGVYARVQRRRVSVLRDRLASLEKDNITS